LRKPKSPMRFRSRFLSLLTIAPGSTRPDEHVMRSPGRRSTCRAHLMGGPGTRAMMTGMFCRRPDGGPASPLLSPWPRPFLTGLRTTHQATARVRRASTSRSSTRPSPPRDGLSFPWPPRKVGRTGAH
jgi:hypothetical protein